MREEEAARLAVMAAPVSERQAAIARLEASREGKTWGEMSWLERLHCVSGAPAQSAAAFEAQYQLELSRQSTIVTNVPHPLASPPSQAATQARVNSNSSDSDAESESDMGSDSTLVTSDGEGAGCLCLLLYSNTAVWCAAVAES